MYSHHPVERPHVRLAHTLVMKKRVNRAPPDTSGDCKPSKGLIDELSTLEAMLEQRERMDEVKPEHYERASEDDKRE